MPHFLRVLLPALAVGILPGLIGCATGGSPGVNTTPATTPPSIVTQPASLTVPIGLSGVFKAAVSGSGALTYQWFRNGVAIPSTDTLSYTTPTVAATDTGSVFTVTISNSAGSVTSQPATLTAGARAPAPGDLRFQQVDSPNTISGYANNGGSGIPIGGLGGRLLSGAIGTPLYLDSGQCSATLLSIGMDCLWRFDAWYQSSGATPLATGYLGDYYSNFESDLSIGMSSSSTFGGGPIAAPNTVVTSMSLSPVNNLFALSWVQTSQTGGFDLAQHTIDPSLIQAAATQEGQSSRVITAIGLESGQLVYFSYGWQGDTTTIYEAQVATATFANAGAMASSLAAQGYIITAIGDDPSNAASNIVMVGTRVRGDTLPRQILLVPSNLFYQLPQQGYAFVGSVGTSSGGDFNDTLIGER